MTPSFLLAPGSGPQDYATRRAMIQAMMPQFGKASTIGEGLGQLFTGIGLGRQQKALDAEEAAARQSAMAGFDSLMSRGGTAQPGGMSINGPIPFTPPAPMERPDPNSPQGIGLDAMAALGHVSPYGHGIASVESAGSGGYSAVGPDTGKGRAYGKYQVMDFNIPDWTLKHTGVRMTPEEFLRSPGAQEAVFNGEFGSYVQKYGNPQDAASVWFSGRPMAGNNSSDGYTTVPEYVQKFNAGMQSAPSAAEWAAAASDPNLSAPQRALAAQMLAEVQAAEERARQQQDPAYVLGLQADQLAIQKAQLELAQMQQPKPGYKLITPDQGRAMGLPEGTYQQAPDGKFEKLDGGPELSTTMKEYNLSVSQGYPGSFVDYQLELKKAGASNTTVNMGDGGKLGTIPQGYAAYLDPATGEYTMKPVLGGPEDPTKKNALAAGNRDTATDIITKAAKRARDAGKAGGSGFGQSWFGMLPFTDSAEVSRQVGVLQSTAKVENLTAMRAASPTGGALGAVSDKESEMLAAKSGALDPSSPNFQRDLMDYTKTLLRTIHGPVAGDAIFAQEFGQETDLGADIPPAPAGIDPADWQYMTPEERALFQ